MVLVRQAQHTIAFHVLNTNPKKRDARKHSQHEPIHNERNNE